MTKSVANFRYTKLIDLIRERKQMTVNELMSHFNVSDMTIRRDLTLLEQEGLIERIHGGAIYKGKSDEEDVPLSVRTVENKTLKERIARCAVQLIQDDSSILLDAGTTTFEIAKLLVCESPFKNLMVVTNDINIGYLISMNDKIQLIMPGGELRGSTKSFIGPSASQFFRSLSTDQAFIGCSGVSFEKGTVMNTNLAEADVKSEMIQSSMDVILVADYHKFNRNSLVSFSELKTINRVITNIEMANENKEYLNQIDSLDVVYV